MGGIASRAELRMSFLRYALVTVPAVVLLGSLSAYLSNAGISNGWYLALQKPDFMPPSGVFGIAWTILYVLLGLSLAMVLHAKGAPRRSRALALFAVQLALNFAWMPAFFAWHRVDIALSIVAAMLVGTAALILVGWRIRVVAGLLLYPYLGWLMFVGLLNYEIVNRNPNAATLEPTRQPINIQLNAADLGNLI
ncbi:TspO/MBR family protein [Sphingosinicella sp.]|uniref:TspO/MBR family protein n=1 Tax=Sphingosinicella sp. TaxID=1917971 RepID=UPI00403763D8